MTQGPDDVYHERRQVDGDLHAVSWHQGSFSCVAVGPKATSAIWIPAITRAGS